jgi:ATP/maltotriose-dependent transcriptional regulator MalT
MGEASTVVGSLKDLVEVFEPLIGLTDHANDPMVETSFLSRVAETQVTRAYFEEALAFATRASRISETLHLDFAIPFCLVPQASAEIGLKRFAAARESLKLMTEMRLAREDPYLDVATTVLQLKLKLSHPGYQFHEAAVPERSWERAHLAVRAEALSLRALHAASTGDSETANRLAGDSMELSRGVDSAFTARFASLIAIAEDRLDQDPRQIAVELVRDCAAAEAYEALVLASRASGSWLGLLKGDATAEAIVERTLVRSGDLSLARNAGLVVGQVEDYESMLTPREREVLSHVARGLSNSAIAAELFITESTVKVHVHHILKKLGVETRLQAALKVAVVDEGRD